MICRDYPNDIGNIVSICCEEILCRRPDLSDELEKVLSRVGWKFSGFNLIPIEIFDLAELIELPNEAHADIEKAASRLRDGDLSGALSASCGAIDSVTGSIYKEFCLGDPNKASFQERIKKGSYNDRLEDFQYDYNEAPPGTVAIWPITNGTDTGIKSVKLLEFKPHF